MSVSHPLIKELKGLTQKLTESCSDITDSNEDLSVLCKCLEKCFQKGVIANMNYFAISSFPEAWQWMEDITKRKEDSLISYTSIVENILENQKVQSANGRLRLLIRTCLHRKCLHIPVGYLVRTPDLAYHYYCADSILGDEILGEILLSVLLQISTLNFRLNLRNASFLDDTWDLPECVTVEFVPCKILGISVCFTRGKSLIVKIEKNSVAAEEERIQVGDILDEINGNIISAQTKGNVHKIMKRTACLPTSAHILKYFNATTGETFLPIENIIKSSDLNHTKLLHKFPKLGLLQPDTELLVSSYNENAKSPLDVKPGYLLDYCGLAAIGTKGDVKQIEKALRQLIHTGNTKYVPVRLECLELVIKVTQESNYKEILKKSYIEISSCGRSNNFPKYFAFIAGEITCSMASNFTAHVFYHKNDSEVQTILQSLGQGFYRTHFAV